jgi:hypothetical protein
VVVKVLQNADVRAEFVPEKHNNDRHSQLKSSPTYHVWKDKHVNILS